MNTRKSQTRTIKENRHYKDYITSNHNKRKLFKCHYCNRDYKTEMGMKYHLSKTHSQTNDSNITETTCNENKNTVNKNIYESINEDNDLIHEFKEENESVACVTEIKVETIDTDYLKIEEKQYLSHDDDYSSQEEFLDLKPCEVSSGIENETGDNKETCFKCDVCDLELETLGDLNMHMAEHSERPYQCGLCKKFFKFSRALTTHLLLKKCQKHTIPKEIDQKKNIVCEICGKNFKLRTDFYQHKKTHKKILQCDECGKIYSNRRCLIIHMQVHSNETVYECDTCAKKFARKNVLITHLKDHTEDSKTYDCEICLKRYFKWGQFRNHMALHKSTNPIKCNICSKVFTMRKMLNHHMRLHSGDKPFQCEICSRLFSFKHHLVKHMNNHDIDKPFKCSVCPKRYINSETLDRHFRNHVHRSTQAKGYLCSNCPMKFPNYELLRIHKENHSVTIHRCSMCEKTFLKESNLSEHMKTHL